MQASVVFMGHLCGGVAERLGFESLSAVLHRLLDPRVEVNPGVAVGWVGETRD